MPDILGGKPIDWDLFEKLCALHCNQEEIAGILGVSVDTMVRRIPLQYDKTWSEIYKEKASTGKLSLRRKQYEIAMSGNVTMLIFLGKQWLGQSDKTEIMATGGDKTYTCSFGEAKDAS